MKTTSYIFTAVLAGGTLFSAPFDPSNIAQDTKWMAHLDVEKFKQSYFGSFLIEAAKSEMEKHQGQMPVSLNLDAILQEIHSITGYGTSFEDRPEKHSVLIVKTGEKAQTIIDGFIASQELSNDGKTPFKTLSGKAFPTHLIANEVYLTFPRKDLIMIGKDYAQIERAMSVIEGRAAKLAKGSSILGSPNGGGFFFFASAEGLNAIKDIPPQARILQKATGLRIAFGEDKGNLLTNLALSTTGRDVSNQLKKIIEGLLALTSFVQIENESLSKLTQSITVTESDNAVAVDLSYPVDDLKTLILTLIANGGKFSANPTKKSSPPAIEDLEVSDAIGGERLKVVNVDASSDDGNMARNANDNDLATYWGTKGRNQWIRFELDQPSILREVQLAWHKGDERATRFTLQASADGKKWTNLIRRSTTGKSDQFESWNVPDTAVRWIRLMGSGQSGNARATLSEARFLGQSGVSLSPPVEAVAAPGRN